MDGHNAAVKVDTNDEDDAPDFEILEEGTDEAKKFAEGGRVEEDDEGGDDNDATLGRHASQDVNDVTRTAHNESKGKRQRQRLKEKLNQKDGLIQSLQQQNREQAARLDNLERRTGSNELAMIDQAMMDTRALLLQAENAHTHSLTQNDPSLVTRAMNDLFEARTRLAMLEGVKHNAQRQVTAPKATNPRVATNVNAFMARNPWFRPDTNDEDSRIAKILDDKVTEDGFDPSTPAYWSELDRRIKKRLPHRAGKGSRRQEEDDDVDDDLDDDNLQSSQSQQRTQQSDESNQRQTRSHVSGSGSGSGGGAGGRRKVVLSRERVQALKDAGKWDDPVERNKMVKQYIKYDRENAAQQ